MKKCSGTIFILATLILIGISFISYFGAFAEDEGTIENGSALSWLAKMFNILRFPTHTLFWNLFSQNGYIYLFGLIFNCFLYALLIERITYYVRSSNR